MNNKQHIKSVLFTEKYRPRKMEDMILPDRLASRFKNGLQDLNRILLHSDGPGTGKCVLDNTLITIRNKQTGVSQRVTVDEFKKLVTNIK